MNSVANAIKVVEFAKTLGFDGASVFFWPIESAESFVTADEAVAHLTHGKTEIVWIGITLCDSEFMNNGDKYSSPEAIEINIFPTIEGDEK